MSQKPARRMQIIRTPQPAPFSPSRRQPAPRMVPPSAELCPRCGSWIGDRSTHDEFHTGIAALAQWAAINEQLMRDHPELGRFPARGDTASDGNNTTTDGK